ncbi:alpha-galactosidase/6-phospho-beta-glucosidase family protein [Clostridium beijerinckii]|nr:alpha-galactosidase/6-phospho-beta-glucosidase family protein [Clostridium beijerinckii]
MIVIAGGGSTFASNPASIVAEACRRLKPRSKLLNICNMPVELFIVWQL